MGGQLDTPKAPKISLKSGMRWPRPTTGTISWFLIRLHGNLYPNGILQLLDSAAYSRGELLTLLALAIVLSGYLYTWNYKNENISSIWFPLWKYITTLPYTVPTNHSYNMVSITSLLTTVLVVTGIAIAKPTPKVAEQPVVTYLGTQGPILCTLGLCHAI